MNSINTFNRPFLRLIKASKDFNVSIDIIADYLDSKGIIIERNPNYKISPEIYNLIKSKFEIKTKLI